MGNVYNVTKCPNCNNVFEPSIIMVHRAINYGRVAKMLRSGMSIDIIEDHFCESCGEYQEKSDSCKCMEQFQSVFHNLIKGE